MSSILVLQGDILSMSNQLSKKAVVISFVLSALFGIALVFQGLFVQEPISTYSAQSKSSIVPDMDKGFASSSWHPEWFRARFFYVEPNIDLHTDITTLLHQSWIFVPKLSLNQMSVDSLQEKTLPEQAILMEFSENIFVQEPTNLLFDVHSSLSYQMYINGTSLATKQQLTLSKGSHLWTIRVLIPPKRTLDIRVQTSKDGKSWEEWKAAEHHGYEQRHGENRTGFRMNISDVFTAGQDSFREDSESMLNDLWFGINEGRFLGRHVIEVHNQDGGMSLSQSRALKLAKWLVEQGSPSKLITVQGYGDYWLEEGDPGRIDVLLLH